MGKHVPKFTKTKEKRVVARWYLQGRNVPLIADHIGRNKIYVYRLLEQIEAEWEKGALLDFSKKKAIELAKIDNLERTYWDAWFRSLGGTKSTTVKASGEKSAGDKSAKENKMVNVERSERNETTYGDPRFLAGVQWCIERRVKMFGFDQPVKFEIVDEIKRKAIAFGLTAEDFAAHPILSEIATRYGLGGDGAGGDRAMGQA